SLSVLAIDASTPGWIVVALMAAFGATAVGWNGVYLAAIARLAPSGQTAFVTGGALAFTYLGVVIGPPMFGAIAEASGSFSVAFSLLAVPLLLCAFLLLGLDDPRRAAAEAPRA
ncbi:MAG: MFS transporter, partial [Pseudomonadota bacterium]|nr:MFS transporter [Pseudomonadota bacterium]